MVFCYCLALRCGVVCSDIACSTAKPYISRRETLFAHGSHYRRTLSPAPSPERASAWHVGLRSCRCRRDQPEHRLPVPRCPPGIGPGGDGDLREGQGLLPLAEGSHCRHAQLLVGSRAGTRPGPPDRPGKRRRLFVCREGAGRYHRELHRDFAARRVRPPADTEPDHRRLGGREVTEELRFLRHDQELFFRIKFLPPTVFNDERRASPSSSRTSPRGGAGPKRPCARASSFSEASSRTSAT